MCEGVGSESRWITGEDALFTLSIAPMTHTQDKRQEEKEKTTNGVDHQGGNGYRDRSMEIGYRGPIYFLPEGMKWKFSPPFGLAMYSASDSPIDAEKNVLLILILILILILYSPQRQCALWMKWGNRWYSGSCELLEVLINN